MVEPGGLRILYLDELLADLPRLVSSLKAHLAALAVGVPLLAGASWWAAARFRGRDRGKEAMKRLQVLASSRPEEAYPILKEILLRGGGPAQIPALTLVAVLSPSREGELAGLLTPRDSGVGVGYVIDAASALASRGRVEAAHRLMTDRLLAQAAASDKDGDKAVGVFVKTGGVDHLVAERCSGKPPEFCAAIARSLERLGFPGKALEVLERSIPADPYTLRLKARVLFSAGRFEEALFVLIRLGRPSWDNPDMVTALRSHLALRDAERARELFASMRLRKGLSARDVPDVYYEYGVFMEAAGDPRSALEAYARFYADDVKFKDAVQRWERLKALPPAGPPSAGTQVSGALGRAAPPVPGTSVPPAPGLIGGKYELRGQIGLGGMGQVLEAWDHSLDRRVAVKKMASEIRENPGLRERFLQEARIVSHLSHPFIVPIHEIVQEGGEIYLVFDFVDGRPLSLIIEEKGRLSLVECRAVFSPVCQAVDHAHRTKVLHRDLKPSNIMVDVNGLARVMDFGLAREAKDGAAHVTRQEFCGTPAYMAPEQHMGKASPASDVFSLGACFYECLYGEAPFSGPDFLAQKERMRFKPLSGLVPGLPAGVDALVSAALAPDPAKRLPGAMEFLQRLLALEGSGLRPNA